MGLEILHVIPCNRIETDQDNYHRFNVIGLTTSIQSRAEPPFPFVHRQFVTLVVCTGGEGVGNLVLRIIADSSPRIIFSTPPRHVRFVGDITAIGAVVFRIQNCVFTAPGLYWIELLFDGSVIARQRLNVRAWEIFS